MSDLDPIRGFIVQRWRRVAGGRWWKSCIKSAFLWRWRMHRGAKWRRGRWRSTVTRCQRGAQRGGGASLPVQGMSHRVNLKQIVGMDPRDLSQTVAGNLHVKDWNQRWLLIVEAYCTLHWKYWEPGSIAQLRLQDVKDGVRDERWRANRASGVSHSDPAAHLTALA